LWQEFPAPTPVTRSTASGPAIPPSATGRRPPRRWWVCRGRVPHRGGRASAAAGIGRGTAGGSWIASWRGTTVWLERFWGSSDVSW